MALERGETMPDFRPYTFVLNGCRSEVEELKELLDSSSDLGEKALRKFFEPRLHLRALIGNYDPALFPDLLAWEYPIFGDFRCDFAVGDSRRKVFTFVECESAR